MPGSTARVSTVPAEGDQRGVLQVQLRLCQRRLALRHVGLGLFDFLRAVAAEVLRQLVFRRLQVGLSLIAGGARILQRVGGGGVFRPQPLLAFQEAVGVGEGGLALRHFRPYWAISSLR